MLDRASSFAREDVIAMLRDDYVPVAIDVWYEERRQDEVGEFYRRIVAQREGMRPGHTTQGFYVARPDGELLRGWNNRDPGKLARWLAELRSAGAPAAAAPTASRTAPAASDPRFARRPPDGGAVVDVFSRITEADWPEAKRGWVDEAMRSATGRDHLWITASEIAALREARLERSLALRIARFHLIDNTRGEPPMWDADEVERLELELRPDATEAPDGARSTLTGRVRLVAGDGARRCDAILHGWIEADADGLRRFDLVARCTFEGEGRYTPNAPPGPFTLVVATRLAQGAAADRVPPQGARDLRGYLGGQ